LPTSQIRRSAHGLAQPFFNRLHLYPSFSPLVCFKIPVKGGALMLLIDNLDGDPKEFYSLIKEEVLKREIPGVKFNDREEFRTRGFLSSESSPALYVEKDTSQVKVFAYQYARSFHVSCRAL